MNYIKETTERLRNEDIIPVLENSLASKHNKTLSPTIIVAGEEIVKLRRQVLELGGTLPLKADPFTGNKNYQKLEFAPR